MGENANRSGYFKRVNKPFGLNHMSLHLFSHWLCVISAAVSQKYPVHECVNGLICICSSMHEFNVKEMASIRMRLISQMLTLNFSINFWLYIYIYIYFFFFSPRTWKEKQMRKRLELSDRACWSW